MNCERCEERHDRIREGKPQEFTDVILCDDCVSDESEAAHERMLENYYGSSSPQTIHEHCADADRQRRELRRLD